MVSKERLLSLFASCCGQQPCCIEELPASGSHRRYIRLKSEDGTSLMGVIGTSPEENRAFIALSRHFRSKGLNVPAVLAVSEDGREYLQEDLGETSLFDRVAGGRESGHYSPEEKDLLCSAMAQLPRLQFLGGEGLDWSVCFPQPAFDGRTVDFDLNYFKYCFLKATGLEFNEVLLQDDFERLKTDLLQGDDNTFLYRDFQARNIMLKDGRPWFIDFQGGRRGPIEYDVASFVWQARASYSEELKQELIDAYLQALQPFRSIDGRTFRRRLRVFVLFRSLQVLGAYGFRGYFERKAHFIASIPGALDNLRELLKTPFAEYPYLNQVLTELTERGADLAPVPVQTARASSAPATETDADALEVTVWSFSFKKGIPEDGSGNGGGYVFDCRGVHNPGRYAYYRRFNGTDPEVIKFLEDDGEITRFLEHVYALTDAHVRRYLERGFSHLQICFGCTGGQHRSVYSAEHTAAHIARTFGVKVHLIHREMGIRKEL